MKEAACCRQLSITQCRSSRTRWFWVLRCRSLQGSSVHICGNRSCRTQSSTKVSRTHMRPRISKIHRRTRVSGIHRKNRISRTHRRTRMSRTHRRNRLTRTHRGTRISMILRMETLLIVEQLFMNLLWNQQQNQRILWQETLLFTDLW